MKLQVVDTGSAGAANGVITVTDGDLILSPSANVGIGTSSPSTRLTVGAGAGTEEIRVDAGAGWADLTLNSNSTNGGHIYFNDGSNAGEIFYYHVSDYMAFNTAGTERMRIDSSGRLGLKTSANASFDQVAGANLFVLGSGAGDQGMTIYSGNSGTGNIMFADGTTTSTQYEGYLQYVHSDNRLLFGTNHATRMTIDSSGSLLIGQTTGTIYNQSSVTGITAGGSGSLQVTGSASTVLFLNRLSTGQMVGIYKDGGQVGSISITASSTAYNTSSDYRLKTDAQPMTGASARVQALNPVNFEWIADGTRVDGFLAHEAQAVVPEAVTGEKDAVDADGNPEYQGIDQSKLVPLLTAALQEALDEITDLKARVATLEAN